MFLNVFYLTGTENRRQKCQGEAWIRLRSEGGRQGEAKERSEVAVTQEEFVSRKVLLALNREQPVQPCGEEKKQELKNDFEKRFRAEEQKMITKMSLIATNFEEISNI